MRYAEEFHCQNQMVDIKKHPLPPLEELVEVATLQLKAGMQSGCKPRKDIDRALKEAARTREWFPSNREPCQQDLIVNQHL